MDKYLICGLGNPGYGIRGNQTQYRIMVLDAFAKASNIVFEDKRYGFVAETTVKGRKIYSFEAYDIHESLWKCRALLAQQGEISTRVGS